MKKVPDIIKIILDSEIGINFFGAKSPRNIVYGEHYIKPQDNLVGSSKNSIKLIAPAEKGKILHWEFERDKNKIYMLKRLTVGGENSLVAHLYNGKDYIIFNLFNTKPPLAKDVDWKTFPLSDYASLVRD